MVSIVIRGFSFLEQSRMPFLKILKMCYNMYICDIYSPVTHFIHIALGRMKGGH